MSILTATTQTWATVPVRIALGSIMFAHGAQKVFGIWGGTGLDTYIAGPAPFELTPAGTWLTLFAFSELLGGLLVLLGLLTRVAAFFIAFTVVILITGVRWRNGFFQSAGGYEYQLAQLGMAVTLLILGGGKASLDLKFPGKKKKE
jgi:putative oxidoreductase